MKKNVEVNEKGQVINHQLDQDIPVPEGMTHNVPLAQTFLHSCVRCQKQFANDQVAGGLCPRCVSADEKAGKAYKDTGKVEGNTKIG